jgi:hypothetical protein
MQTIKFRAEGRALNRANHAIQITRRSWLPPLGQRLAIYLGTGAALVLIILETLVWG